MNSKRVFILLCTVLLILPIGIAYASYDSTYGQNNYYGGDRGFRLDFTTEHNKGAGYRTREETGSRSGFRTTSSDFDSTGFYNDRFRRHNTRNTYGDSSSSDVTDVYSDTYANKITDTYSYDDTQSIVNGQVYGNLYYGGNRYRSYNSGYPSYGRSDSYNNYPSSGRYSGTYNLNVYGNQYESGRRLG